MSRTSIIGIDPGESAEVIDELSNSWQSGPLVWEAIKKRYAPHEQTLRYSESFWQLYRSPRLKPFEQAVFMMTFDHAYVARKDYARAAEDLDAFMKEHDVAGHWVTIRDLFRADPDHPAIGFWLTSVSENPWDSDIDREFEDKKEFVPPNWDSCYSIYDELVPA